MASFAISGLARAEAVNLSQAEARRIGQKIWQNECGGTISGLTSWNAGENFASLGIGHFIWYPKGARGPFEESFPDLIAFATRRGVKLPEVVTARREDGCPWKSRGDFLAASQTPAMQGLRRFLADTVDVQAEFLVQRLQQALPKMFAAAPSGERAQIEAQFARVASTPQGCYALVDYVNFKGEGLLDSERYRGQGWGLFQVLQNMNGSERGASAAEEFSRSARSILTRRVKNSPPERNESRWLAGWLQRVNSYTKS
ncbi:MAG: hypothetical protein M3Y03_00850 [Verrucomicrobiota bacterium]|nr:hypothetical protein [Verrucomicrobiota bacterium]